ncbi:MAG: hypothetical protein V4662_24650 [Verrucomicrobiota bacterium]
MAWLSFRSLLQLLPTSSAFINPRTASAIQGAGEASVSPPQPQVRRLTKRKSAEVYRVDGTTAGDLVVKVINRRKGRDFLRFFTSLTASKAGLEHEAAQKLEGIGLQVAPPVASFRNWNPFSTVDSVFVAEFVPDLKPGDEYIATKGSTSEAKTQFLEKYVHDMKHMLDAGFLNVDAHPGNVLWSGREQDPLVWIDNEVETFPPAQRAEKKAHIMALLHRKSAKNETRLTDDELAWLQAEI